MSFSEEDLQKQQEETARLIAKAQEDAMAMVNAQMEAMQSQMGNMMDFMNSDDDDDDDIFMRAENPETDADIKWALSAMAFTSLRFYIAVDGLTTYSEKSEAQNSLDESWGIQDPESLGKQIFWLKDQGHRGYYQAVLDIARQDPKDYPALIKKELQENMALAAVEYDDFAERIEILGLELFHQKASEIDDDEAEAYEVLRKVTNVQAWDDSRITMLCRTGIESEWMSEKDAKNQIIEMSKILKKTYKNIIAANAAYFVGAVAHFGSEYLLYADDFQKFMKNVDTIWE